MSSLCCSTQRKYCSFFKRRLHPKRIPLTPTLHPPLSPPLHFALILSLSSLPSILLLLPKTPQQTTTLAGALLRDQGSGARESQDRGSRWLLRERWVVKISPKVASHVQRSKPDKQYLKVIAGGYVSGPFPLIACVEPVTSKCLILGDEDSLLPLGPHM